MGPRFGDFGQVVGDLYEGTGLKAIVNWLPFVDSPAHQVGPGKTVVGAVSKAATAARLGSAGLDFLDGVSSVPQLPSFDPNQERRALQPFRQSRARQAVRSGAKSIGRVAGPLSALATYSEIYIHDTNQDHDAIMNCVRQQQ